MKKTCAIIGAGVAGAMTAVTMIRGGWDVTLIDRSDPLHSGHGAFILGTKTQASLAEFGIDLSSKGTALCRFLGFDFEDNKISEQVLDALQIKYGYPLSYVGRAELIGSLLAKSQTARHLFHHPCTGVEVGATRTTVFCEGDWDEDFDLVVVADGVRSQLRSVVSNCATLIDLPFFGCVGKTTDDFTGLKAGELADLVDGSNRMVFIRTDSGHLYFKMSAFVSDTSRLVRFNESIEACRDFALTQFSYAESQPIQNLLKKIKYGECDMFYNTGEHVLRLNQNWYRQNVILIGDAAHCMTPALGQGANQAIMDGILLAKALRDQTEISDCLKLFEESRKDFLGKVSSLSTALTLSYAPDAFDKRSLDLNQICNHNSSASMQLLEELGFSASSSYRRTSQR